MADTEEFGYLQNKNDKEKLSLFLDDNHDELSEMPEDMFMVMASLSGRKQQKELEK